MAAIEVLDAEVITSGGEIITHADRVQAVAELDAAIGAMKNTFPRLASAVARVQRLKAWEADDDFINARMLGKVESGGDQFMAWAHHRYSWSESHAYRMGAAGRVIGHLQEARVALGHPTSPMGEVPIAERQVRDLTKLLKLSDAAEVIPQVWEQAADRASGDLSLIGGYIRRIIDEQSLLPRPSTEERAADLDRKIRQFRGLFNELQRRMNDVDFDERVIGWINEQVQ